MMTRLAATGLSLAAHAIAVWFVLPDRPSMQERPALKGADAFEVSSVDAASLSVPEPPPQSVTELPPPTAALAHSDASEAATAPGEQPTASPKSRSTPRPAKPAAAQGGRVRSATQEGLSEADKAEITAWQRKVALALAAAKTYPETSRRAGHEGEVLVVFTVAVDGRIVSRNIRQSSGHTELDAAAVAVIDTIGRLPAPPAGIGETSLAAPFTYRVKSDPTFVSPNGS